MKLTTSIQPRKDGTLRVTVLENDAYVFRASESGELECEVLDKRAIVALLQTGNFYPANEADFEAAMDVMGIPKDEPEVIAQPLRVVAAPPEPAPASVTAPAPRRAGKARAA